MAEKRLEHGYQTYTITSPDGKLSASFIPERGGICYSILFSEGAKTRQLLYLHDFFWQENWHDLPGGWPFLFPVCARVQRNGKMGAYLYEGQVYQMPMHGFAWQMPWQVIESGKPNELTLFLCDTPQTQAVYPFSFSLTLIYTLHNEGLRCEQVYINNSEKAMPYYAGFHPYFLTPLPGQGKEQVVLTYKPVKQYRYNEDYTDLVGEQPLFSLPAMITEPNINEQLTKVADDKILNLTYPDGFQIKMEARGITDAALFSYVQLYTMASKPFFCLEPWMSFPNAINAVTGVRWLTPGKPERACLYLALSNP